MIAETARVSKRTVYRHFDDKYSLFAAVIQMLCESVVPASVEDLEVDTSDPREALIELGVHFLERIYTSEQIELYRIVVAEAKRFPEIGKMYVQAYSLTARHRGAVSRELGETEYLATTAQR